MGLVTSVLAPLAIGALHPGDDWYYQPIAASTAAGVYVTNEAALKVSTVYACVRLIAETIGSLPLHVYERFEDGGRERAPDHPLSRILHAQPNTWQTSQEWVAMCQAHKLLRGNAYSRIIYDGRGQIEQLIPIHPDLVTVERLSLEDAIARGRRPLRYQVLQSDGMNKPFTSDDIYHERGLTLDGYVGLSVIDYARQTIGSNLAMEQHSATFFGNGSRPGGILEHPGKLKQEGANRLKADWESAHRGPGNANRVAVLEEGMKYHALTISNQDSQFIESREYSVLDICRWFAVPPHMVGETTKSTAWGTGLEEMSLGFVTYTLVPWLRRSEQSIGRDLIDDPLRYFASYIVEGLLRGNIKTRYDAYAVGRTHGWLSANDVRRKENENPIENGDIYLQPLNYVEAGSPPPQISQPEPGTQPSMGSAYGTHNAHHLLMVTEAAERVIRREIATLGKAAKRCAGDGDAWKAAVQSFYSEHADHVAEVMHVGRAAAGRYCQNQQASAISGGAEALMDWEATHVTSLVALAMAGHGEEAA